ncbi:hypothetical protein [Legionella cherrii]|uniref:Class I SAM-dependent methyltransferase n=1 Tax=Legionella cherrii TaxID=28084 RepID=A0A0W0S856_9GAMM|nr:hypothetical protein [Legionella cherrii]KTC79093.1 hypothetical protein Lche_1113 [Legionella cherrii]VEB36535.1 Uncharacterised protein [Legionella cherrii]
MLSKVEKKLVNFIFIPRLHLFEFGDLAIPDIFHDMMRDYLGFIAKMGIYNRTYPIIEEVIEKQNCSTIIDMCTGSGVPALLLREYLMNKGYPIHLVLTDKFPHQTKAQLVNNESSEVNYLIKSVDATDLPQDLKGLRTLFASLHHFKPKQVQAILQNAVDNNQPIAALEFTERNWLRVFLMFPGTLHLLLATPFIKPFSLSRFFWTYVIPVVPMIYFWDGLVSNLRTYSERDLRMIISKLKNNNFDWDIKKISSPLMPINITYLIGQPQTHQPSNLSSVDHKRMSTNPDSVQFATKTRDSVCVVLGMLSGFFAFLISRDPKITLAVSLLTAILCWVAPNNVEMKMQQYGRFFRPCSSQRKGVAVNEMQESLLDAPTLATMNH